jgi:hypothetical protein
MIIKSLSRKTKSYHQLIDYLFHEKDVTDGPDKKFLVLRNVMKGNTHDIVRQFELIERGRIINRKNSNRLYHEIISFDVRDSDKLSEDVLVDIANEYIDRRTPYGQTAVMAHHEKEHIHLHFCISGVDLTGNANSMSKAQFTKLKQELQEIQIEKYGLTHSVVDHGSKERTLSDKEVKYKNRTGSLTKKEIMIDKLKNIYMNSISRQDFIAKLSSEGLEVYSRGGKATGVIFEGKKHRFSTLGFEDKLQALDERELRLNELQDIRQPKIDREKDLLEKLAYLKNELENQKAATKKHAQPSHQNEDIQDKIAEGISQIGSMTIKGTEQTLKTTKKVSKYANEKMKKLGGQLGDEIRQKHYEKKVKAEQDLEQKELDKMNELRTDSDVPEVDSLEI